MRSYDIDEYDYEDNPTYWVDAMDEHCYNCKCDINSNPWSGTRSFIRIVDEIAGVDLTFCSDNCYESYKFRATRDRRWTICSSNSGLGRRQ